MDANIRGEVSLVIVKYLRCLSCASANPTGARRCPVCGEVALVSSETRRETSSVANIDRYISWYARLLLAIGAGLRRLALRIRGEC